MSSLMQELVSPSSLLVFLDLVELGGSNTALGGILWPCRCRCSTDVTQSRTLALKFLKAMLLFPGLVSFLVRRMPAALAFFM